MKYTIVSSAEFTYPDRWDYPSASSKVDTFGARGSFATFQVLISEKNDSSTNLSVVGLPKGTEAEIYALVPVQVEENCAINPKNYAPHYPERMAPYWVFDCLRPFDGTVDLSKGVGGIYVAVKIEKDCVPGDYDAVLVIDDVEIPLHLKVYAAVLPEETLKIAIQFQPIVLAQYHDVTLYSEEYFAIEETYLAKLRRMHQRVMFTRDIKITKIAENQWDFDFTNFIAMLKRYDEAGFTLFIAPCVGRRKSWKESTIYLNGGQIASMSFEGYCFLSQYLPKLRDVLRENGFLDRVIMEICDEPNTANQIEFRALCGLVRKIVPEIPLADAVSHGDIHGALDIWIPLNSEYDRHMEELERFRLNGDEMWHYVCCSPRKQPGYINRFLDYPLLSTRYLHWGNYKYNLTGFLHWASQHYQPGQDPFTQNCPLHRNADQEIKLPPGDTHILYPGKGEAWMSIRLETEREGAEEYELLRVLAEKDKVASDEICESMFRSFKDVEYDVNRFIAAKKRLLEALS